MAGAVVASLLIAIAAFRWWPLPSDAPDRTVFDTRPQEVIALDEILPTRQRQQKPPPPAPVPPVVVPDDVELPDSDIELPDNLFVDSPVVNESTGAPAPSGVTIVQPDAGPRPVRFVEPEYTSEAQSKRIRAEIVVEVLVDTRGRVKEAHVTERYVLKGKDGEERERVAAIGFGLEESAVAAAGQWMFRPARAEGRIVESWTTLTFSFGL